jgi:hypothetical protein
MKVRGLIIACLILLALVGLLYWSEHRQPASAVPADASLAILKLDEGSITGLQLKKKDAAPILLAKANSGDWQITQPQPLSADQNMVSGMLGVLSSLNAERLVEDKATDLKAYGLETPALEVDVATKNGEAKLLLGDDTPAGQAVYAMHVGDPRIFTLASFNKSSLDKSLNDLRDKRLLKLDAGKIDRIELVKGTQDLELARNPSTAKDEAAGTGAEWQILKPRPLRAGEPQVEELARKLAEASMELSGSEPADEAAAFAHATPLVTAKVNNGSGIQELQIRKDKDAYYAKSSAVDGAYKVSAELAQALDKSVDDLRNKKLFDFGFSEPGKVELHSGAQAYFLTQGTRGYDWWSNGKKMDPESVETLLGKLRNLTATSFADSGFTSPTIEATVTSGDGKHVEKVLIAPAGDHYIAQRASEPELYQLDASAVEGLQKAAAGIKPAGK